MAAVIKELAGVSWHGLGGDAAALGTGECGEELSHAPASKFISGFSKYVGHSAESATNAVAMESITGVARAGAAILQLASTAHARLLRR